MVMPLGVYDFTAFEITMPRAAGKLDESDIFGTQRGQF